MGIFNNKTTGIPNRRQAKSGPIRPPAVDSQRQNLFQRNRTLTGSTSDKMTATHHPTDLESPRTHVHHLAIRRRKIGTVLMMVFCIVAILLWLLTQLTAKVAISVSDPNMSRSIETALYSNAINDYLGLNPLSRLRFAMNQSSLNSYLAQVLPEVSGVIESDFSKVGESDFTITVRQPVAGWKIDNKQYFVDAKGVAFERNYYLSPSVQIIDNSGVPPQHGATVASNRFLGFVGRVVAASKDRGYVVTQAILPPGTTRQLEIRIKDVGPLVRLSIDRPAGEQVEDMSRSLGYLSSHSLAPGYIDVRVSGKAFYQ